MGFIGRFLDRILHSLFISAVLTLSIQVLADQVGDQASEKLNVQLQALQNPEVLAELIKNNPAAQNLLQDGVDPKQAAEMMSKMIRQISSEGGGSQNINKMREEIAKDPQKAINGLSDEQKKMIESLGIDMKALQKQLNQ